MKISMNNQHLSKKNNRFWPSPGNVTVFAAGTKVDPPGATFGPRTQVSFEFLWVRAGTVKIMINRQKLSGSEGTLLLIPAGARDRYDWTKKQRSVHSFLHFFAGAPPKVWPPEGPPIPLGSFPAEWPPSSQWPLYRNFPPGHTLFHLFRQILSFYPLNDKKFRPLLGPLVEMMLRLYLGGPAESPSEAGFDSHLSPCLEIVLPWLREQVRNKPLKKIRLSDMAQVASVSPQHLCRLFRKDLKLGPIECLRLLKTEYACEMVERSRKTIKEISHLSGFENPFNFSRVFKGIYGLPPKTYREGFKKGTHIRPYSPIFRKYQLTRLLSIAPLKYQPASFKLISNRYRTKFN